MRCIDLSALEIFRTVVHEGGVVRAANRLHRVQSNVTTRIKQLEQRLGVALFHRSGRSLVLTESGETLLVYAERLLKLADEAENATRSVPSHGVLKLGSMESTAASRLPEILSQFHQNNIDTKLQIQTGTTAALVKKVTDYQLEAAFVGEPVPVNGLQSRPVFTEELVLVTAKGHQAVRRPGDLKNSTMLAFAVGCSYRSRLESWFSSHQTTPDETIELASYQAIIACAAAGTGCGLVPVSVLDTLLASREVERHTLPKAIGANRTHLVWADPPSPRLQKFFDVFLG
jgi:DNA-binding transcriptional LysR family regulator